VSLAISVDKVKTVLLADGWHDVAGASFTVGAYEYARGDAIAFPSGQLGENPTGFGFREPSGDHLYGPLTAILAVRIVRRDA
jgi:hypothetical protein